MTRACLDLVRPELAGADENRAHPDALGAGDVAFDVVADHPGHLGVGVERLDRRAEVGGARLAEHDRLDTRHVFEPRDEGARVEPRAVGRLPPAVLVQAVELGAGEELEERAVQVEVGEDPARLGALVAAADEHGVGVHPDQLDPVEVVEDPRHRQREHALAGEHLRGDAAGRLELVVLEPETHLAEASGELGAGHRRRVRDEPEPVAGASEAAHGIDRTGDRLAGDMQHTVHVEQNRRHGRRVYSVGTPVPLLTVERAGRAACSEELDTGRGDLRRRGFGRAQRGRAAPGAREARPDGAGDLPGRALTATESRARNRADRRAGRRRRQSSGGSAGRRSRRVPRASAGSRRSASRQAASRRGGRRTSIPRGATGGG